MKIPFHRARDFIPLCHSAQETPSRAWQCKLCQPEPVGWLQHLVRALEAITIAQQLQMHFPMFLFLRQQKLWKKVELDESRSLLEDSCEFVRSGDLGKADQEKMYPALEGLLVTLLFNCTEECT